MILLGIWNFRCLGKYLAVMTGIVFLNMVYEKLSSDFEEDMETDYDISNSDIESDINSPSLNWDWSCDFSLNIFAFLSHK